MTTPNAAPLDLDSFAGFTPGPHVYDLMQKVFRDASGHTVSGGEVLTALSAAPALLAECKRLRAENERLREALQLAEATICRLKPPVPYDSTQGTRDVIRAALEPQS